MGIGFLKTKGGGMTKRGFIARLALFVGALVGGLSGVTVCRCAYEGGAPRMIRHRDGSLGIHGFKKNPPQGSDQALLERLQAL